MMSMAGDNLADVFPDPLSMIMRVVSIEMGSISTCTEIRPTTGSFDAEVVVNTSGTVICGSLHSNRGNNKLHGSGFTGRIMNCVVLCTDARHGILYLSYPGTICNHNINVSNNNESESIWRVFVLLPS